MARWDQQSTVGDATTVFADHLDDGAILEAAFMGYDPVPVYSATGIWVPFQNTQKRAYGAHVGLEMITGFLE